MDKQEIQKCLKSIGKEKFVTYFETFKECNTQECIDVLVKNKVSNTAGANWRCGRAKPIFDNKQECYALKEVIENSKKIDESVKIKAKELFQKYCR